MGKSDLGAILWVAPILLFQLFVVYLQTKNRLLSSQTVGGEIIFEILFVKNMNTKKFDQQKVSPLMVNLTSRGVELVYIEKRTNYPQ